MRFQHPSQSDWRFHALALVLLCSAVVLLIVLPHPVTAEHETGNDTNKTITGTSENITVGTTYNGIPGAVALQFWSHPPEHNYSQEDTGPPGLPDDWEPGDRPQTSEEELQEREENTLTEEEENELETQLYKRLGNETDWYWQYPRVEPAAWNINDFGEWSFSTSDNVSRYPQGTETRGSIYIEDAHATTFAIAPTTRAYVGPNEEVIYTAVNGNLSGIVDWRVDLPANDTTIEDDNQMVTYSIQKSEVEEACILVGPRGDPRVAGGPGGNDVSYCDDSQAEVVFEAASPAQQQRIEYELTGENRPTYPTEFVYTAAINVEVQRDIRERELVEVREDEDGNEERVYEWNNRTVVNTDRSVVTDRTGPIVVPGRNAEFSVRRAVTTNGIHKYAIQSPGTGEATAGQWSMIRFEDGIIYSNWRFWTTRDRTWDVMVTESDDGTSQDNPPVTPVRLQAHPAVENVTSRTDPEFTPPNARTWGVTVTDAISRVEPREAPTLPESITVPQIEGEYEPVEWIIFERPVHYGSTATKTVRGMAPGQTIELDLNPGQEPVEIRDSTLESTLLDFNDTHMRVRVELTDEEGEPINTSGRKFGYVTVADKKVNTTGNGRVEVIVKREPQFTTEFHPSDWYRVDGQTAYKGSREVTAAPPEYYTEGDFLSYILYMGIYLGTPILLVAYLANRLFNAETWPPRKLITMFFK